MSEESQIEQPKDGGPEEAIVRIAAVAHYGGLIGFADIDDAMCEIRRLSAKWVDQAALVVLQSEPNATAQTPPESGAKDHG